MNDAWLTHAIVVMSGQNSLVEGRYQRRVPYRSMWSVRSTCGHAPGPRGILAAEPPGGRPRPSPAAQASTAPNEDARPRTVSVEWGHALWLTPVPGPDSTLGRGPPAGPAGYRL